MWSFGEAFGGIFAPGATWLFGAPGRRPLLLRRRRPDRAARTGLRHALASAGSSSPRGGVFLIGMAVLQAWPGRGYWQGGRSGTLTGMVRTMAQTSQPHFLSSWIASFGSFDAAHGWAVNLFSVVALAVDRRAPPDAGDSGSSSAACSPSSRSASPTGCSSRIWASSVASGPTRIPCCPWPSSSSPVTWPWSGLPVETEVPIAEGAGRGRTGQLVGARLALVRDTHRRRRRPRSPSSSSAPRPMAMAAVNQNADPILTEALDGSPNSLDLPAPHFALDRPTRQPGQPRQPPGPHGGADLPRPRLHIGLPADRPGVPPDGPAARRPGERRRLRGDRRQPDLPVGIVHERLRPPGVPRAPAAIGTT